MPQLALDGATQGLTGARCLGLGHLRARPGRTFEGGRRRIAPALERVDARQVRGLAPGLHALVAAAHVRPPVPHRRLAKALGRVLFDGGASQGRRRRRLPELAAVARRAAKGCEILNFQGSYLSQFPLVSAHFWTSDHLSSSSRTVNAFSDRIDR